MCRLVPDTSCVCFLMLHSCFVCKFFYSTNVKTVSWFDVKWKQTRDSVLVVVTFAHLYSNLFTYPLYIGLCLLLMLVYSVIYLLLAIYVERVNPGEFGVAQPWNYLFKKSYWKPKASSFVRPSDKDAKLPHTDMTISSQNHWIEPESKSNTNDASLTVSHLTKVIYQSFLSRTSMSCVSLEIWQVHCSFWPVLQLLSRWSGLTVGSQWCRKNNNDLYSCRSVTSYHMLIR